MNRLPKYIRDRICVFSGEEYTIISRCSRQIQWHFSLIGLLVLAILFTSFASALYFTEHLFHNVVLDVFVGLVWGYIVTNMYVLLLYTISPHLLPVKGGKQKTAKTEKFNPSFSLILRLFVVVLLAVIIAQPINVLLFKPESTALAFDIKLLLSTHIGASIATIIIIGIFLLPVYLKYTIRRLEEFYRRKTEVITRFVLQDYAEFKRQYKHVMEAKIIEYNEQTRIRLEPWLDKLKEVDKAKYLRILAEIEKELCVEEIEKYEYWADAPFRTIRKYASTNIRTEQDLLAYIYPEI